MVSIRVAPTLSPSISMGKMGLPVTLPENSTMSVSRYSKIAGAKSLSRSLMAALMQLSASMKGRNKITSHAGFSMSFRVSSVMTPRVPSLPRTAESALFSEIREMLPSARTTTASAT